MEGVPLAQRTAKFVCAIYCILGNGKQLISYGECVGRIGFEPIGEGGFGYDPVFLTQDGRSYAQLTADEKDKISHRGRALTVLKSQIEKYYLDKYFSEVK